MLRRISVVIVFLLVLTACSDEQPLEPDGPTVVSTNPPTTTTAATPDTVAPTSAPPTTEAPSTTTTSTTTTTIAPSEIELELVEIARGFEQPVLALSPPGDPRLFILDQPGRIWFIEGDETELFLDLRDDVIFGGERGLLGLAFHPDFAANGRLFVNYTGGPRSATRIVELQASEDRRSAEAADAQILLEIEQPARNHNGGMIAFGPDGHLWIATGDGGGSDDRYGQGQRADTLLAALLRIDVATPGTYTIPADNPFADGGGAPEVWAFGLRNPWRFTIDGDELYVADVGQNTIEEVNKLAIADSRGANFGWPIFEGTDCFAGPCDTGGLIEPVVEYSHRDGCSVSGGYVYRGPAIPSLTGHYFYADWCSGWIRSLSPDGETFEWFGNNNGRNITSFGQDLDGELYVVSAGGSIYRLDAG
ncbi:MAG: PQQ-dependent sugar dehydrogenase [Acidimicrobiia bacterium]